MLDQPGNEINLLETRSLKEREERRKRQNERGFQEDKKNIFYPLLRLVPRISELFALAQTCNPGRPET